MITIKTECRKEQGQFLGHVFGPFLCLKTKLLVQKNGTRVCTYCAFCHTCAAGRTAEFWCGLHTVLYTCAHVQTDVDTRHTKTSFLLFCATVHCLVGGCLSSCYHAAQTGAWHEGYNSPGGHESGICTNVTCKHTMPALRVCARCALWYRDLTALQ